MLAREHFLFFQNIVGELECRQEEAYLRAYAYDATREIYQPDCVLYPQNEDQISQILIYCNTHHIPVVPRGAGSGMSGGALSIEGGVVLAMEKYFNQILEIDKKNLIARVQPAVINKDFQKVVEKEGLFYPPDPASQDFSTLGGNVSENAGGMRAVKYGITKDYVMALRMVLPNGKIIRAGKKTIKDVAGYNLAGIISASEGTLGVITEITLKLLVKPKYQQVLMGVFQEMQKAMQAVYEIMTSGVVPVALEFLDSLTLRALEKRFPTSFSSDAQVMLLIQIDGEIVEYLQYQKNKIQEIFIKNQCQDFKVSQSKEEADFIWSFRRNASQSLSIYGKKLNEDVTVPRSNLPKLLEGIETIGRKYGFKIPCFGHAGDGNVHVNIMVENPDEEHLKKGYEAVKELFILVVELEGTLSGEHGIGISKAPFMSLAFSEDEMELFRAIKKAFDPNNILNPHKMGL
ncbi:FAD-linked oxidase C-terminal domain-containing protein [Helicobacter anatolicus]|nr:FAD-linked oxidase C-terminal domain-containing protein [Helicobacter anatolicus]MCE3039633.1 FAD-binding protein [Helicobacter anatolicus]